MGLDQHSKAAEKLGQQVRLHVLKRVEDLSNEQLADKLGLLPTGVEILRRREHWPLETAVHIATALGIAVSVNFEENTSLP